MADPEDGRQRIPPLAPFEEAAGFTRAIRVGDRIIVSGNVGVEEDGSVSSDAGRQADRCFEQILAYIEQLGGYSGDVVRVRMFVTDMADADAVTAAFTRAVGHARPAATLVAISALYDVQWKCEIEAEAVIGSLQ
ncbi:Rid family hydrolase [Aurantiacibacter rhizosphaerae]|uniref:Rid family hydrolase n=1 Tax=Aurantiacibacter rhizosphaerae TaxID=2691582 RepID=UPI00301E3E7B